MSEERLLKDRKEELKEKLPEIFDIDREIGKLCIKLSMNHIKQCKK